VYECRTSRPSQTPRQQEKESEEKQAPDFTVEDREGNPVKLSDLFGKPIVLNFWASWCPPCKKEMPEFEQAYKQMGEDVTFVMVDLVDGRDETKAKGAQYIEEKGFSFPVYFDMEQEAAYAYGISSIPTTLFIDKDGFIVTGAYGMLDSERLQEGINRIRLSCCPRSSARVGWLSCVHMSVPQDCRPLLPKPCIGRFFRRPVPVWKARPSP